VGVEEGVEPPRFCLVSLPWSFAPSSYAATGWTETLLVERRVGVDRPTAYWLCGGRGDVTLNQVAGLTRVLRRTDADLERFADESGLRHFEGRGWRGFHHHAALCVAAHAFLLAEEIATGADPAIVRREIVSLPGMPKGFKPRGSPR
jgi:SRSO17 transposase